MEENFMRGIFVAMLLAASLGIVGTSGSYAAPASGLAIDTAAANATIIEQTPPRCHCVERRWNGSCKRRTCDRR
jgi:hypothetical protein